MDVMQNEKEWLEVIKEKKKSFSVGNSSDTIE
jgi:hypothetical protein